MPLTCSIINIMKNIDLAYIAGLFDGEGSISLAKLGHHIWSKRSDFSLLIRIHNTRKDVLNWVAQVAGGKVYTASNHPPNGFNKVYQWLITGPTGVALLIKLKPFIKIKNRQIDIAIAFQQTKERVGAKRQFRHGVPTEITQKRLALYEQLKITNRKGTTPIY